MKTAELLEDLNFILQERGFEPGTIRTWGEYEYKKLGPGKWKKLGRTDASKKAKFKKTLKRQYNKKLPHPPPFEKHIQIAEEAQALHKKTIGARIAKLQTIIPAGGIVQGRPKEIESIIKKVAKRGDEFPDASKLHDLTGTRMVVHSIEDVLESVRRVKENYKVTWEEDRITQPKAGYRSYHLVAEDTDGLSFEIQIRTPNQHTWAEWAHPIYKAAKPEERRFLKRHQQAMDDYSAKMSAYFYSQDNKKLRAIEKPECPPAIAEGPFGCVPDSIPF
jgi:ppGpp synthetase/RelA/SpoT-type nucleotidyltranferase